MRIWNGVDKSFSDEIDNEMFENIIPGNLHWRVESAIQLVNSAKEFEKAFNRAMMLRVLSPKFIPATWEILDPVEIILCWKVEVLLIIGDV